MNTQKLLIECVKLLMNLLKIANDSKKWR